MLLSQDEIIKREYLLHTKSYIDIKDKNKELFKRKSNQFVEFDYNMPQTIFFIFDDSSSNIIVGRKTLSQYYLNKQLESLNCSRIQYNMLLGILKGTDYSNRKIIIDYFPFSQEEKKFVFDNITKNLNNYNIEYPYRFKFFDTNLEQTSDDLDWNVDEEMANYLSTGESHIRKYTCKNLIEHQINPKTIYDPACSTGEFLKSLKKVYPKATTIGHDLSKSMVDYSRKNVDQSLCCDAFNSPIKNESIDLLLLRFLNGGVVDTENAHKLFDVLIKKVVRDGHILCIGHTPILIKKEDFINSNLNVIDSIGYDKESNSIFQYYLAKKM